MTAREVASGDFGQEVARAGPREASHLAADVNSMRERIRQELSAARAANASLQVYAEDLKHSTAEQPRHVTVTARRMARLVVLGDR